MKRVLIPGVILCGADVAQAVDDKNMYMHFLARFYKNNKSPAVRRYK